MAKLMYKAWLETRWRFWAGLLLLVLVSVYGVFEAPTTIQAREQFTNETLRYPRYIWILMHHGYLQSFWIFFALILSMGGILREKSFGNAGFTLSFPVSRRRLVWSKAIVGLLQLLVLAFVPSILISALSPLIGAAYPLGQSVMFGVLMFGGGLIFYAWGFFLAHLLQGEFSSLAVAISTTLVFYIITRLPQTDAINLFDLMSGKHSVNRNTFFLESSLPWTNISLSIVIALTIIFAAQKLTEMRDF